MADTILWILGILNFLVWGFNLFVSLADDRSGAGMVLMFSFPFAILISLVSLVIVGFIT